jgi:type II secretory pathway pseudopilin PulG
MELLVVITIIGILAAMVFPVANGVLRKARQTQAKNDALQLKQSITTYFTEYRKFPVKSAGGGTTDMTVLSDNTLMDVLMGSDNQAQSGGLNPRRITFYSGKKAKGNPPKAGVVLDATGGGELFDPWGEYLNVVLDTNRSDRVADPISPGTETIPQSVIVWSSGPNAEDEKGEGDDIVTW